MTPSSLQEPWRYNEQEVDMMHEAVTAASNRDAAVMPADSTVVSEMSDFQKRMLITSLDGPDGANGDIPPSGV